MGLDWPSYEQAPYDAEGSADSPENHDEVAAEEVQEQEIEVMHPEDYESDSLCWQLTNSSIARVVLNELHASGYVDVRWAERSGKALLVLPDDSPNLPAVSAVLEERRDVIAGPLRPSEIQ